MTTIATDGLTMAGDGLITGNGLKHSFKFKKVVRLSDGRIVGWSGSCYAVPPFLAWLEHGGDKPSIEGDFEALVIQPGKPCVSYDGKCVCVEQEVPAVTGSGGAIALGAMLAGATPAEAVSIAALRDVHTGGDISNEALSA